MGKTGEKDVTAELARVTSTLRDFLTDVSKARSLEDCATAALMAGFELDGVEVER
jgi:hypothetical protein